MLDARDLLDVRATVDATVAAGLRDAELGKLGLPRSQHVGLHVDELAHLGRLEQRTLRDVELNGTLRQRVKSIARSA